MAQEIKQGIDPKIISSEWYTAQLTMTQASITPPQVTRNMIKTG